MSEQLSFPIPRPRAELAPSEHPFPVISSASLGAVRWRLFGGRRRDPYDLPDQTPDTALVFERGGRFIRAPHGQGMLSSSVVVEATSVALVSMRQQLVSTVARLPSVDPAGRVELCAVFRCLVMDPVMVLEAGCFSVEPALCSFLLDDNELLMLGARADVAANPEVARHILARVTARTDVEQPTVPGMTAEFVNLDVRYRLAGPVVNPLQIDAEFSEEGFDGPVSPPHDPFLGGHGFEDAGPYRLDEDYDDGYDDGPPRRENPEVP